jgi:hypothetical protein
MIINSKVYASGTGFAFPATYFCSIRISILVRKDTLLLNDFTRFESTNKHCNGRNLVCWIRLEANEISVLNVQKYEKNSVEFKNWYMGFRTRPLNLSIVNNNASTLQLYKTSRGNRTEGTKDQLYTQTMWKGTDKLNH